MASIPTPEETAVEILTIFVSQFRLRAGGVLSVNNFLSVWHTRGLVAEDFGPGMEHAVEQGWVEIQPDGTDFKLTDSGFAKA